MSWVAVAMLQPAVPACLVRDGKLRPSQMCAADEALRGFATMFEIGKAEQPAEGRLGDSGESRVLCGAKALGEG